MKGHLGFVCRVCQTPSDPQNLRQVGVGFLGENFQATLAWDAPASNGSGPILGYVVEQSLDPASTEWITVASTDANTRSAVLFWCDSWAAFRVTAVNRCGQGTRSANTYGPWTFVGSRTTLVTRTTTLSPPCWATQVRAWCVGCGGTFSGGGGGGGMVRKTWSRNSQQPWSGVFSCVVRNAANEDGPALSSIAYSGESVAAYGGSGPDVGSYSLNAALSSGDSASAGNPGGNSYTAYSGQEGGNITYPFTGAVQYSGPYTFGGGIGGQTGINPDGTAIRPAPVSPCRRHPARNRAGLLDAVSLVGMRVTEECVEEPAFGSGGVTFTMPIYGGSQRVDFTAGYGGGGFDAINPGGPGCIVVQYS